MNDYTDYTFNTEAEAHAAHRIMIRSGFVVSMVGFDTALNVHTFTVFGDPE